MAQKVPVTVVTGFLGAGKTSLIRHWLENAGGRRIALIVNEFGDVGVDGEILRGCGIDSCSDDDIMELANGCLCCTVADDFVPTMEALLDRDNPPEHIVIETSGLALPKPLVKAVDWPTLRPRVTVDGVAAVVDGRAVADGLFAPDPVAVQVAREADDALDHETPLEELFEEQLGCADLIIVNKTDLIGDADWSDIEGRVREDARAGAGLIKSTYGAVPPAVALGLDAAREHKGLQPALDRASFPNLYNTRGNLVSTRANTRSYSALGCCAILIGPLPTKVTLPKLIQLCKQSWHGRRIHRSVQRDESLHQQTRGELQCLWIKAELPPLAVNGLAKRNDAIEASAWSSTLQLAAYVEPTAVWRQGRRR